MLGRGTGFSETNVKKDQNIVEDTKMSKTKDVEKFRLETLPVSSLLISQDGLCRVDFCKILFTEGCLGTTTDIFVTSLSGATLTTDSRESVCP